MPVISVGDYEPPSPQICAGCGNKIADRYYLLAVDRQWHVHCLTCSECKLQLDSELTCFARDGNIYCKEDYYRLFAVKRCARCQRGIFANELVMRARELVYHLHCFTCAWCNAALTQGDYFGLRDNLVYCRAHYELMVHGENFGDGCRGGGGRGGGGGGEAAHPPHHPGNMPGAPVSLLSERSSVDNPSAYTSPFSAVTTVRKGRPRKRKTSEVAGVEALVTQNLGLPVMDASGCSLHLTALEAGSGNHSAHSAPQRTKRMRTSFKHHQLRTMKSYFAINQNPDAKDLKQLAQKTGLSKRVLQVWFQNARAKWRRNNLKQSDQTPSQQSSQQPPHSTSPGATSSFSEPSPVASCAVGSEPHPPPPPGIIPGGMEYDGNPGALTPRHVSPGGDTIPMTSFQELF